MVRKYPICLAIFIVSLFIFPIIHMFFFIMIASFIATLYFYFKNEGGVRDRDRETDRRARERKHEIRNIQEEEYYRTRARLQAEREHKRRWGNRGAVP